MPCKIFALILVENLCINYSLIWILMLIILSRRSILIHRLLSIIKRFLLELLPSVFISFFRYLSQSENKKSKKLPRIFWKNYRTIIIKKKHQNTENILLWRRQTDRKPPRNQETPDLKNRRNLSTWPILFSSQLLFPSLVIQKT